MRKATIRDLRYRFKEIEALLRNGDEIVITKRKRAIARLRPEPSAVKPDLPDFKSRLQSIFGEKVLGVSGADLIRLDRDRE
jgi:antitoxin (DNA-binding transcriptional repressor) of toxin-antitoxin stability system